MFEGSKIDFASFLYLPINIPFWTTALYSPRRIGSVKQRPSETFFLFSDGLLAQTVRTACVRSAHILLVEFRFHMGHGLLSKYAFISYIRLFILGETTFPVFPITSRQLYFIAQSMVF